jgi:hypothetical protein
MANILSMQREKLYRIYTEWPSHFENASDVNCRLDHEREYFQSVLLCGRGARQQLMTYKTKYCIDMAIYTHW